MHQSHPGSHKSKVSGPVMSSNRNMQTNVTEQAKFINQFSNMSATQTKAVSSEIMSAKHGSASQG